MMPTKKKKKFNARFPPARIKKIMQSDEDVGKVAAPVPVIISRALELFVETLLKNINGIVAERGAKTLTPSHLKKCILLEPRFDFLREVVRDIPDLQGDRDDRDPSIPSDSSSAAVASTSSSASSPATYISSAITSALAASAGGPGASSSAGSSRQLTPRLQRQLSTPRPRGRPRKGSTESGSGSSSGKTNKSSVRFTEVGSDESDSQLATDEEDDGPDSKDDDHHLDRVKRPRIESSAAAPVPTYPVPAAASNGHNNGISAAKLAAASSSAAMPNFTITIPPLSLGGGCGAVGALSAPVTTSTSHNNGQALFSMQPLTALPSSSSSHTNGIFSMTRLLEERAGPKKQQGALSVQQPHQLQQQTSSYVDVDEDYDA